MNPAFAHIDTWVFDLDNTLYPASCRLFDQMHVRMSSYISRRFGLSTADANHLRSDYFRRYGTTLSGLIAEHQEEPSAYLAYVHDIDYAAVPPSPALDVALDRLPGRKLVFTAGTVAHAERVLARLGVSHHFGGIFDIVHANYVSKPNPAPYDRFLDVHGVAPQRAIMFEDISENLEVPHGLGMVTVLVKGEVTEQRPAHVDHMTSDLAAFLQSLTHPSTPPGVTQP
jgi:putative hydrolase of the HAD superfamily